MNNLVYKSLAFIIAICYNNLNTIKEGYEQGNSL